MKLLVTGGAGFIGSHVAEFFAKNGWDVTVFDNLSRNKLLGKELGDPLYNWKYLKSLKNVELIKGDVRKQKELNQAAKGAEVIMHTAAQVAVTTSLEDPRTDFETNACGTFNALEAARKNDSKLLFTSTNKVYGENVNNLAVTSLEKRYKFSDMPNGIPETFSIDRTGHSPYGSSKLSADIYCQDYAETYHLKTGVFRMSCIYGTRQFGVEDQGWVAWFTIATLLNKKITIYGDGKQVRDVLFISDLVDLFNAFIKSNEKHVVVNTGGGVNNTLSLLELLDIIEALVGKRPNIEFADWRPADQKVYISDLTKVSKLFGWVPKVSPKEGVSKLVLWAKKYGFKS